MCVTLVHERCLFVHTYTAMDLRLYFLLILHFLINVTLVAAACTTDPCDSSCQDCGSNQWVADPENCLRYYICDGLGNHKYTTPAECPIGETYDATSHACSGTASCTDCPRCFYDCQTSTTGKVSDQSDCNLYAECSGTTPGSYVPCPQSTPYFDGYTCQAEVSRCCNCHPYCPPGDSSLVADPIDCRRFHQCDGSGGIAFSSTCSSGQYFDAILHGCSPNVACYSQCENVVGADGCIDLYTCTEKGYFPKCPALCDEEYYYCSEISSTYADPESCPVGYVFHPYDHVCIVTFNCP